MEILQFGAYIVLALSAIKLLEASNTTMDMYDEELNAILSSGQRQGRWGIFFSFEPICTMACRKNGKLSGRMYGGVCRCYCPRTETDPCKGLYPSCDRLCRQNSYHLGGDCLDDTNCYCFCTVRQRQTPNGTVTSTTAAPCAAPPSSTNQPPTPPAQAPIPVVPAPGSLGLEG